MVHNYIWNKVNPKKEGMLCIGCLESRLGRYLKKDDFTDCPLNLESSDLKSKRLVNRLRS